MKRFLIGLFLLASQSLAAVQVCPRMPVQAAVTSNFLTAISAAGAVTVAQPAYSDLSGNPQLSTLLNNLGLSASISSNTLVIALKQADGSTDPASGSGAVSLSYRSSTQTTGSFSVSSYTGAASITLSATDSLGVTSGGDALLFVYSIDDTSDELGVSATRFDDGEVKSATALTAGAEVSPTVLYATSAHTSKPIRLIGRVNATWSNPNWGTISSVAVAPFPAALQVQVFTADGTWVAPRGVTRAFVLGRGGSGGGGGGSNNATAASGGGGGGAVSVMYATDVVPATSYSITIGAQGSSGAGGTTNGADGGGGSASTFGSLISFKPGHGGPGGANRDQQRLATWSYFGAGPGGHGGVGKTSTTSACGDGAPSGVAVGGACNATNDAGGGGGGDGPGGAGGAGGTTNPGVGGTNGTTGGGGGGGGYASSTGNGGAGGTGTTGRIAVYWYE